MLNLVEMAQLKRPVRQEDIDDLGKTTQQLLLEAIDAGRLDEARRLAEYTIAEGKSLHDLFCDWIWDMQTQVARRFGEEALGEVLRASQQSWMLKRTWKGFLALGVEQRMQLTMEMMRAHHGGPRQDGSTELIDAGDHYVMRFDPCGSGGRMRRGDPVDGTPSRLGPPYNFGVTQAAHDWSWGKTGVPYYCTHCAMNEILPMEWGGHPLWVTDYDPDASKPCQWRFYKTAEAIPAHYYQRVGRSKPAPGEGRY
ncbi:hypothetical protein [Pseudorhodoferax sp.]|uniref:hypothetical protein n=1 Tax=Pseudorhodoferax sp. TaxID=1993553 RepID=UPI002DD63074|nr:hypothetical protein [Pseudorhodoferax sp.]